MKLYSLCGVNCLLFKEWAYRMGKIFVIFIFDSGLVLGIYKIEIIKKVNSLILERGFLSLWIFYVILEKFLFIENED